MKGLIAFPCGLAALWCALGGFVALLCGWGVGEVVAVELVGLVLAVLATGLYLVDNLPRCGHDPNCEGVR